MSYKLKRSTLFAFCAASSLFALDEYMPIPVRVMQINLGLERTSIAGQYLDTWESDGLENTNNPTALPMEGKFGLMEQLEASLAISYLFQDSSGATGLDRPILALKYGDSATGVGGFLAVALPVGFDDIMISESFATITLGGMYGKAFGLGKIYSNASYGFSTQDDQKNKIDNIRLFAKPEYSVPMKSPGMKNQYLGVNLGVTYDYFFNRTVADESVDMTGHLLQIAPGAYYTLNNMVSAEMALPLSLAGQNTAETVGFRFKLFFTLDEGLYNTL